MINPEVFLLAAELLFTRSNEERYYGCCTCVYRAAIQTDDYVIEHTDFLAELFLPEGASEGGYWWDSFPEKENVEARLLALLLAAEIAKDEQRKASRWKFKWRLKR